MENVSISWEDDDNNRVVEFAVACSVNGDQIEITQVTPANVKFMDAGNLVREIGVWTDAGRRHLVEKLNAAVSADGLTALVEQKLLAAAN